MRVLTPIQMARAFLTSFPYNPGKLHGRFCESQLETVSVGSLLLACNPCSTPHAMHATRCTRNLCLPRLCLPQPSRG